ncbi:hypothetical protein BDB01DRAFT_792235 [Pilobolus umbonatus]|nr:hypothetical protein BDB01DRAFT_792235 [Pilobolus umbonatus]
MSDKYKHLKVKELQELLQKSGIPHSGKKEELIERLVKQDERNELQKLEEEFDLEGFDSTGINFEELSDPLHMLLEERTVDMTADEFSALSEKVLSDDEEETRVSNKAEEPTKVIETAKKGAPKETTLKETPVIPLTSNEKTNFKYTPITFTSTTQKTESKAQQLKKAQKEKEQEKTLKLRLEVERRLERSKRFGVKLNEEEMKQLRAVKYGLADTIAEKKDVKKSVKNVKTTHVPVKAVKVNSNTDEDKLKKRAERFGLPVTETPAKATPAKNTNGKGNKIQKIQQGRIAKKLLDTKKPAKALPFKALPAKKSIGSKQGSTNNKSYNQKANMIIQRTTAFIKAPVRRKVTHQKSERIVTINTSQNNARTVINLNNESGINRKRKYYTEPQRRVKNVRRK